MAEEDPVVKQRADQVAAAGKAAFGESWDGVIRGVGERLVSGRLTQGELMDKVNRANAHYEVFKEGMDECLAQASARHGDEGFDPVKAQQADAEWRKWRIARGRNDNASFSRKAWVRSSNQGPLAKSYGPNNPASRWPGRARVLGVTMMMSEPNYDQREITIRQAQASKHTATLPPDVDSPQRRALADELREMQAQYGTIVFEFATHRQDGCRLRPRIGGTDWPVPSTPIVSTSRRR